MSHKTLKEDWEFNILGIYNYRQFGPLHDYFTFVYENHAYIEGDLLEAGVFRGRSLLGMALMLKDLGSKKKIYGYDTWSGFPPVLHENDAYERWDELLAADSITEEHYQKVQKNIEYCAFKLNEVDKGKVNALNSSTSGSFDDCSAESLQAKVDFLGLDNVVLVKGPFNETMKTEKAPFKKLISGIIDADLYESYNVSLPFIWNKLSLGGYLYLDEYYSLKFPGARISTDEFFEDKEDKPCMHKLRQGDFERWHVRKLHA